MRKNFFNFLFGKKNANVSNINNIININNYDNDDDNECIDSECNITKIPSSKSLEIKEIKKDSTKEEENDGEEEEQEELQKAKLVNAIDNKYCSKCSYPLTPQAFEEIKTEEDRKLKILEEKHSLEIRSIREEMHNQFNQLILMIQQNPNLAQVKPEVLISKNKV